MQHAIARLAVLACLLASPALLASPVSAGPLETCIASRDPAARLEACSAVILDPAAGTPERARALRIRGSLRADAGALDAAIADLSESVRLDPGDAAAHAARARARLARGLILEAIGDFTAALELAPGRHSRVALLIGRGHAQLARGEPEAALVDFTEALRLDPDNAAAYNNRGLAFRKMGDIEAAIADYTSAIALEPAYALAHANRGHALEALGKKKEAIGDFTRALELDASLVGARDALRRLGAGALTESTGRLIAEGQVLVEARCSACHATGASGKSPHPKAPAFRHLRSRYPVLALRDPLTRGIAAPHEQMPRFDLSAAEIDRILAWINNLAATSRD